MRMTSQDDEERRESTPVYKTQTTLVTTGTVLIQSCEDELVGSQFSVQYSRPDGDEDFPPSCPGRTTRRST